MISLTVTSSCWLTRIRVVDLVRRSAFSVVQKYGFTKIEAYWFGSALNDLSSRINLSREDRSFGCSSMFSDITFV